MTYNVFSGTLNHTQSISQSISHCCGRVLEQSYMAEDTKLGTKRKHADLWFVDPLNPHERKRMGWWPVGLKNVGNTCWFSAVIQVCFQNVVN